MSRARDIANFGDGIATADIGDGQVTAAKLNSTLDLSGKTVTLPAGTGGKVLQVVQSVYTTQESTTSTSFVNTGLVASITPSSTSSKVLIFITNTGQLQTSGRARYSIIRDGTTLLHPSGEDSLVSAEIINSNYPVNLHFLDSPNTTSSVSYELQYLTSGNTLFTQVSGNPGIITLMEIAG